MLLLLSDHCPRLRKRVPLATTTTYNTTTTNHNGPYTCPPRGLLRQHQTRDGSSLSEQHKREAHRPHQAHNKANPRSINTPAMQTHRLGWIPHIKREGIEPGHPGSVEQFYAMLRADIATCCVWLGQVHVAVRVPNEHATVIPPRKHPIPSELGS